MTPNLDHRSDDDPCAELPTSFRSAKKVANIAEKPVSDVDEPAAERQHRVVYQGPHRVLRTSVSSMACSDDFGPMMKREAQRRRLFEMPLRAFLGDGGVVRDLGLPLVERRRGVGGVRENIAQRFFF